MACQRCDLLHGGVPPHVDLVLAVAVGGYELINIFGKHEIADLAACLDRPQVLQLDRIPELYSSVLRATACGQQTLLVRRPCNRLHGRLVLVEPGERL